jgi:hypothetical protein
VKTYIVKEYDVPVAEGAPALDLSRAALRQCAGCWNCWLKTPGRCVHRDLDTFYREYLAADKVTIYCTVSQGFVTSNMKAMIDRMIPLILPDKDWSSGETLHPPRYTKYPDVEVRWRGEFLPGEEEAFAAWWKRTLGMMFAKDIVIKPFEEVSA